jgi:hypothetical protein
MPPVIGFNLARCEVEGCGLIVKNLVCCTLGVSAADGDAARIGKTASGAWTRLSPGRGYEAKCDMPHQSEAIRARFTGPSETSAARRLHAGASLTGNDAALIGERRRLQRLDRRLLDVAQQLLNIAAPKKVRKD